MLLKPTVLARNCAPWVPMGACDDQPLPAFGAAPLPRTRQASGKAGVELPADDKMSGLLMLLVLLYELFMPRAAAVPEPVDGAGLAFAPIPLLSNVQAVMVD